MAKSILCFVFAASAGSLAAAGGPEDEMMLVQTRLSAVMDAAAEESTRLSAATDAAAELSAATDAAAEESTRLSAGMDATTEESACRCLSWKDVFTSGNYHTRCGDGPAELAWTHHFDKPAPDNHYREDFCRLFLHKLETNACINFRYGTKSTDQWCFVDKSCSKANQLAESSLSKVGYKLCTAGKDFLLREQHPQRIWQLANESHVDPAMLVKWSYPITGAFDGKVRWPGVQEAMGLKKPSKDSDVQEARQVLEHVKKSKQSMIFESDEKQDGQPPFGFVYGNTTWEVTRTPFLEAKGESARFHPDVRLHTEKVSKFTCIEGC